MKTEYWFTSYEFQGTKNGIIKGGIVVPIDSPVNLDCIYDDLVEHIQKINSNSNSLVITSLNKIGEKNER